MVDTVDLDSLTDEEFAKLSEEDFLGNAGSSDTPEASGSDAEGGNPNEDGNAETADNTAPDAGDQGLPDSAYGDDADEAGNAGAADPNASADNPEDSQNPENADLPDSGQAAAPGASADAGQPASAETPKPGAETKTGQNPDGEKPPVKGEKPDAKDGEKPGEVSSGSPTAGMKPEEIDHAVAFFKQITTPFKADGKDFTVRSPQDAIRLMQQGVNYARRMQELKPMRQINKMLQDHDLADPEKLSYLIDLNRGDKAAVQKLLKDKGIDPLDLDISKDPGYQATNYAGNPQDISFQDALDNAVKLPEGQALISDIHKNWDMESKNALRDQPEMLSHLMEHQRSGIYGKIVEELNYQRAMGYLTSVPFVQAYNQVGQAMQRAGLLGSPTETPQSGVGPMSAESAPHTQVQKPADPQPQPQAQPLASGTRKVQPPKKAEPNPHLSSTPSHAPGATPQKQQPDLDKLSDEEFLKLAPPV